MRMEKASTYLRFHANQPAKITPMVIAPITPAWVKNRMTVSRVGFPNWWIVRMMGASQLKPSRNQTSSASSAKTTIKTATIANPISHRMNNRVDRVGRLTAFMNPSVLPHILGHLQAGPPVNDRSSTQKITGTCMLRELPQDFFCLKLKKRNPL